MRLFPVMAGGGTCASEKAQASSDLVPRLWATPERTRKVQGMCRGERKGLEAEEDGGHGRETVNASRDNWKSQGRHRTVQTRLKSGLWNSGKMHPRTASIPAAFLWPHLCRSNISSPAPSGPLYSVCPCLVYRTLRS